MHRRNTKNNHRPEVAFCALMLIMVVAFSGCKKNPEESQTEPNPPQTGQTDPVAGTPESPAGLQDVLTKAVAPSLAEVVARARTWGPGYTAWQGKQAPDFTVTDLDGKEHKLSDYRGRNVMLILWQTWCPPCRMEIPHLIELRNTIGPDKLAMLGISPFSARNTEEMIKSFVAQNKDINYPIIGVNADELPRPFGAVVAWPSSFFIDPEGKIKLGVTGMMALEDTKAVLEAK